MSFFDHRQHETIGEVFESYDLTPAQARSAWRAIETRWQATSGRFYAYAVAHEIAANNLRGA